MEVLNKKPVTQMHYHWIIGDKHLQRKKRGYFEKYTSSKKAV